MNVSIIHAQAGFVPAQWNKKCFLILKYEMKKVSAAHPETFLAVAVGGV
jgi:hypothetical protein